MKLINFLLFFLFISVSTSAQQTGEDNLPMGYVITTEKDTIFMDTIQLQEVVIGMTKADLDAKKRFDLLKRRVYMTYPYAKLASEKLTSLNKGMSSLKTEKEKKVYFKIVENYLSNEFEEKLKKLSRGQGQILIKLINRQTGITTFDLVKNLKSGWSAFWSNSTAKMFNLDLKAVYSPQDVNEDFLIESILVNAFESGKLIEQKPAKLIDFEKIKENREKKAEEASN